MGASENPNGSVGRSLEAITAREGSYCATDVRRRRATGPLCAPVGLRRTIGAFRTLDTETISGSEQVLHAGGEDDERARSEGNRVARQIQGELLTMKASHHFTAAVVTFLLGADSRLASVDAARIGQSTSKTRTYEVTRIDRHLSGCVCEPPRSPATAIDRGVSANARHVGADRRSAQL